MLGEVLDMAAGLAEDGEPTVARALAQYSRYAALMPTVEGQLWVSVAFLVYRHEQLSKAR